MIMRTINLFLLYAQAVVRNVLGQKVSGEFQAKCMYESQDFVDHYIPQLELQKPELAVLNELKNELSHFKMLDIGVGTGRTTGHFAKLVSEYVGVDYSSKMVETCRLRFPQYRIEIADARDLHIFDDAYFDFVLFSFNGIDAVEHEDRLKILKEIRRVIRKGGYFCFSTLNLNFRLLSRRPFAFHRNPWLLLFDIVDICYFLLNANVRKNLKKEHVVFYERYSANDMDRDFLTRLYWISPNEQMKQLKAVEFSNTKVYSLKNGDVVGEPKNMLDYYIYFLTRAS